MQSLPLRPLAKVGFDAAFDVVLQLRGYPWLDEFPGRYERTCEARLRAASGAGRVKTLQR